MLRAISESILNAAPQVACLSALPSFLYESSFWQGALSPRTRVANDGLLKRLAHSTSTHQWAISGGESARSIVRDRAAKAVLDVAQGLLERGSWTLPSWRMEQHLALLFRDALGAQVSQLDDSAGNLGYRLELASKTEAFDRALVTGRFTCEAQAGHSLADEIWASQPSIGLQEGSEAEFDFLSNVLVPVLGLPLLDFLHLQRELVSLGLDEVDFARQRTDFVLESYRGGREGLRLVIEVDGTQHTEDGQRLLDQRRDDALKGQGWDVWRVPTSDLSEIPKLRDELTRRLLRGGQTYWGAEQMLSEPRQVEVMTCVWGATVAARMSFLLLEAVRRGILPWGGEWRIGVDEHETEIARLALDDFCDWFGRLRTLYGDSTPFSAILVPVEGADTPDLFIDISVTQPHLAVPSSAAPTAWSRPANRVCPPQQRRFEPGQFIHPNPSAELLESFVRDLLRKPSFREGQYEILSRILGGKDVVGLLPTGGGKSLPYQLASLLMSGLTVYVAPLKSLIQDQAERLAALGIDLAVRMSSDQSPKERLEAQRALQSGRIRFLLIAPERFLIQSFRDDLASYRTNFGEVAQVVIDECHCVSEWGHDFRPAYLSLSRIARDRTNRLGTSAPLVALTGTASAIVLEDIKRELGILSADSTVRARRLDRQELWLECRMLQQASKRQVLLELVSEFVIEHPDEQEGLLVFCRFAGGTDGVLGVAAEMLKVVASEDLRFYSGREPDWSKYAAMKLRKKSQKLSQEEIQAAKPTWALASLGEEEGWERVKARVQREFLSGIKGSFRVLVATHAFGMGIDKPSIRRVVHFMSPQSPEAYYQEVGRAGRDRKASGAILLFSDEYAIVADKLLSPENSLEDIKKIYEDHKESQRYSGGDFVRTFYFHDNTFAGEAREVEAICNVFAILREALIEGRSPLVPYKGESDNTEAAEKDAEYAITRLIYLGVVRDYVKDYNKGLLSIEATTEWLSVRDDLNAAARVIASNIEAYLKRYEMSPNLSRLEPLHAAGTIGELEKAAAEAIIGYVYDQIERKRRQASRTMLEFVRIGSKDPAQFRSKLLNYLQATRYTEALEELAREDLSDAWVALWRTAKSEDDAAELHGGCSRALESYPTHAGLLCLSALTREPTDDNALRLSEEEFRAALKSRQAAAEAGAAMAIGEAVCEHSAEVDLSLRISLQGVFGTWLIVNGHVEDSVRRFFGIDAVRAYWLKSLMGRTLGGMPEFMEI